MSFLICDSSKKEWTKDILWYEDISIPFYLNQSYLKGLWPKIKFITYNMVELLK